MITYGTYWLRRGLVQAFQCIFLLLYLVYGLAGFRNKVSTLISSFLGAPDQIRKL
jgi:hypothetical protein